MVHHLDSAKHVGSHRAQLERLAYSPSEAAGLLGISRSQLYKIIGRREIRTIKAGRRKTLISKTELVRWVERGIEESV